MAFFADDGGDNAELEGFDEYEEASDVAVAVGEGVNLLEGSVGVGEEVDGVGGFFVDFASEVVYELGNLYKVWQWFIKFEITKTWGFLTESRIKIVARRRLFL